MGNALKKYSDFMDELSSEELFDSLLGYGLFSDVLPQFLSSEDLLNYFKGTNCKIPLDEKNGTQFIEYQSLRNTNIPRFIGIPLPTSYYLLCKCLSENRNSLQSHFKKMTKDNKHKISRIHIRKMKGFKSIFKMGYDDWKTGGLPEVDLLKNNQYVVHADISNCFGSIYSHSISRAILGKSDAKNKRNDNKYYNQLDKNVRRCKYNETNGILIGPHASNVISEIILTSVDYELSKKWKNYIRHIDDYTCYVQTADQCNEFLIDLESTLKIYNLSLNHKKTEIYRLPIAISKKWVNELDNIAIYYRNHKFDFKGVKSYLDKAVDLMRENSNNSAILNYAIKCIPAPDLSPNGRDLCVKYIFHLCRLFPYLLKIVDEFVIKKFGVEKDLISEFTNEMICDSIKRKNFYAVSYLLFLAVKYEVKLSDTFFKALFKNYNQDKIVEDCITCLLVFLYSKKFQLTKYSNKIEKISIGLLSSNDDFERNWLLVYEACPSKKFVNKLRLNTHIVNKDFWKDIKLKKVSFIKKNFI